MHQIVQQVKRNVSRVKALHVLPHGAIERPTTALAIEIASHPDRRFFEHRAQHDVHPSWTKYVTSHLTRLFSPRRGQTYQPRATPWERRFGFAQP